MEGNSRFRGTGGWIVVGIIAAFIIGIAALFAFGPSIIPLGNGPKTETGDESATSGPGHNTTQSAEPPANTTITSNGQEQIPDSSVNFGRETAGAADPSTEQTINNTNSSK